MYLSKETRDIKKYLGLFHENLKTYFTRNKGNDIV